MSNDDRPLVPRWLATAIYPILAVLLLGTLVVHLTGAWQWHVDGTAYVLIGVLLSIPIVERLRKVKVGNYVEAEFMEVREKIERIGDRVIDLSDSALSPEERSDRNGGEGHQHIGASASLPVARTIDRIVWVDDRPANNRLEIDELRRRFDVFTATATQQGLEAITAPKSTLVITDAVRMEDGDVNVDAGLDLLRLLSERHPEIPVYVYCGRETIEKRHTEFEHAGARLVTASYSELIRRVRADARSSFEADVASRLSEHGEVRSQAAGLDFVLTSKGRRIGVEAKDYRRTPKAAPFDAAVARLIDAHESGEIDEGLLVAPRDVFIAKQRDRTPSAVRLVPIAELPQALLPSEAVSQP